MVMSRPELCEVQIPDGIDRKFPECAAGLAQEGLRTVTMSPGQWDDVLEVCYSAGWLLLELNSDEVLTHAYQKPWN